MRDNFLSYNYSQGSSVVQIVDNHDDNDHIDSRKAEKKVFMQPTNFCGGHLLFLVCNVPGSTACDYQGLQGFCLYGFVSAFPA